MRFCGLETDGKLLEDAGDKVLGDPLLELLPPPPPHGSPPPVIKGRNGGSLELLEAALEFVEAVVVVVKGLVLFGDDDKGEAESVSPPWEEVEDRGSLMVDEVTEVKMGK